MNTYGIVILAAGASTRLGQPKQLLQYQGESLIQRIARIAVDAVHSPVVVVLGAHAGKISPQLSSIPVQTVYNEDWTTGIASSIKKGLQAVLDISPKIGNVLFAVCDQPHISTDLFLDMITEKKTTNSPIIACSYDNSLGTPVLFSRKLFHELMQLKDAEGAKSVMQLHPDSVKAVLFPKGNVDIDWLHDLAALKVQHYTNAER